MSGQQRLQRWRHNLKLAVELVSLALWLVIAAIVIILVALAVYAIVKDYRVYERQHQKSRDETLDRLHRMWNGGYD